MTTWKWDPRGTDEADVATTDSGIVTGAGTFTLSKGTSGTIKYDTAFPLFGTSNCRVVPGTTAATEPYWASMGTLTGGYARWYMRLSALPTTTNRLVMGFTTGSTLVLGIDMDTAGKMTLKYGSASGTIASGSIAVATAQWIRMELSMPSPCNSTKPILSFYNSPHSTTPTETITTSIGFNCGTSYNAFRLPARYQYNGVPNVWIDGVEVSDVALPAPLADPAGGGATPRGQFFPFLSLG